MEWNQVGDLWPNLETLKLNSCTGLTTTILSENVIPRLGRLRSVVLPLFMLCRDDEHYNELRKEIENRKKNDGRQVEIKDKEFLPHFCPFQLYLFE